MRLPVNLERWYIVAKRIEVVFGMKVTTQDSHFVLNVGRDPPRKGRRFTSKVNFSSISCVQSPHTHFADITINKCISEGLMHVAACYHGSPGPKLTKFRETVSIGQTTNRANFRCDLTKSV